LIEENYLNEERFAILFAGGKFRIKQWGRIKIKYELKQKQVSDYCIKKALAAIDERSSGKPGQVEVAPAGQWRPEDAAGMEEVVSDQGGDARGAVVAVAIVDQLDRRHAVLDVRGD